MLADAYFAQLLALLPPGVALSRDAGSPLAGLLGVTAAELARVEARGGQALIEAVPDTTDELLPDWERAFGLPDPCLGAAPTVAQRRARLVQQVTASRGQSRAFFIGLAATLGYAITITEFAEYTCELDCEQPVHDTPWRFAWRVGLPQNQVAEFTCLDGCETPLAVWGETVVECVFRALAPAHTLVFFAYGG
jgi:uncharacterized protein YmfQ (DUF2313 family)